MENKLQNYSYIKYLGLGCFLILISLGLYSFELIGVSRDFGFQAFSNISIVLVIAFIVVIAPFLEEVSFRLLIKTGNRILNIISIACASVFVMVTFDYVFGIICLVLLISTYVLYVKQIKFAVDAQIIVASTFFSLIHFGEETSVTNAFSLVVYFLYFFGMGLILSWIKLNYSLLHSFLVHALFNAIFISILVFEGFNADVVYVNCGDITFDYKKNLLFADSSTSASFKEDTLVLTNSNIIYMLDTYLPDHQIKEHYIQTNMFIKYDLAIQNFYDSDSATLLRCLEEQDILVRKNE